MPTFDGPIAGKPAPTMGAALQIPVGAGLPAIGPVTSVQVYRIHIQRPTYLAPARHLFQH
ncbi:hypothetical protein DVB73_15165 [Pseudomonas plecoglossicida]|uniref:Uncharacterized protein n=1 Tax=Pseudomonas plecoglossicida TaxID=70775 RepID=A0AAD0QWN0_PSEDL|nr:hypothetical protein DVB73_15165 [Pseudomonas plecoglossicida]